MKVEIHKDWIKKYLAKEELGWTLKNNRSFFVYGLYTDSRKNAQSTLNALVSYYTTYSDTDSIDIVPLDQCKIIDAEVPIEWTQYDIEMSSGESLVTGFPEASNPDIFFHMLDDMHLPSSMMKYKMKYESPS